MSPIKLSWPPVPVVFVPPAYTSQTCSRCHHVHPEQGKSYRNGKVFKCGHCGLEADADWNAANNIATLGVAFSENTALFSILGTTYGGNGRTTFALPDLRGRVPLGVGSGPGLTTKELGEQAGAEFFKGCEVAKGTGAFGTATPVEHNLPPYRECRGEDPRCHRRDETPTSIETALRQAQ